MKLVVPFVPRDRPAHVNVNVNVDIRPSLGCADSGGIFLDSTLPTPAGAGLLMCTDNIVYRFPPRSRSTSRSSAVHVFSSDRAPSPPAINVP